MLPSLPDTDLLVMNPDVIGIDIWSDSFSYSQIPSTYGCYAFYDAETKEVVYIGSACGTSCDKAQIGLRARIRFYRGRGKAERPTSTIMKVRNENEKRKLLLKCWSSNSVGDSRKYEDDAIKKYKPLLNWIGTREITLEEHQRRKREQCRRYKLKMAGMQYNPGILKKCPKCGEIKKCSEFHRNMYKKYGVGPYCKNCKRGKAVKRFYEYYPEILKKCPKCGETKKCSDFPCHKHKQYGVGSYCKSCMSNLHRLSHSPRCQ